MGPSIKFVSAIKDAFSNKRKGKPGLVHDNVKSSCQSLQNDDFQKSRFIQPKYGSERPNIWEAPPQHRAVICLVNNKGKIGFFRLSNVRYRHRSHSNQTGNRSGAHAFTKCSQIN